MSDLFALAKQDKVDDLKALFNKGIGVKAADENGRTLLHHAAASNALKVIDLLVERKASLDVKDNQGYIPVTWAAKQKCEAGVLALIERGADPNAKLPDGSWVSDWMNSSDFPERVVAARQTYATRSAASSSNLLLSILNASAAAPAPQQTVPNTAPSSSASSGPLSSPVSPSSNNSNSSTPAPMMGSMPKQMGTMRRSTISIKATAEKDAVMSAESSTTPRSAVVTKPSGPSSSSSALSVGAAPTLGATKHARSGSVNYATLRPRNVLTLSSTEGTALREEVAAQIAKSNSFKATQPIAEPAPAPAPVTPIVDPSAGSAVSAAFSASAEVSEKDKKGKGKKDKDKKKEKKDKDKDAAKSAKAAKRKKAEDEANAKAEAKAEKTKKRKTISFFGTKTSKDAPAVASAPSSSKTPSTPSAAPVATPATNSQAPAPQATTISLAAAETSPPPAPTASKPAETNAPRAESSNSGLKRQGSQVVGTEVSENGELISVVDNIPEGAVALPNGDFLIGVETDAVNLDALTDATVRVMKESVSPLLGTSQFDLKSLLDATKVLSTTIKSILSVSDVYALTLDSTEATTEFSNITNALRSEIAKSLVLAIKALSANSADVAPLKKAMVELSSHVSRLYKCLEAPLASSIVEMLQGVVVALRGVVAASKNSNGGVNAHLEESTPQGEAFLKAASQAVVITMRLCSSVQDFSYACCKSIRNERSLGDSAFALAQSVRGLIVAASGVFADPKSEPHANAMAQMLKTAAEYVRAISRTLRDEEAFAANARLVSEADHLLEPAPKEIVAAYLRKGCGMMASAKDKYIAKSNGIALAGDEKQVLNAIVGLAQLVATIMEALDRDDLQKLATAAVSTGQSITTLQRLMQPILDTTLDSELVEETVVCLENIIRTAIQVKILSALIASHPHSSEMRLQLAQLCQLWGSYVGFLLDAFYRAVHLF